MMWKKSLPVFLLLSSKVFAQHSPDPIHRALDRFEAAYPMEKVYLHTDKPYYAVRDTLWFKAYLVDASVHHADSANSVLYVDLFNQEEKKIIVHQRVRVTKGSASGAVTLSDSLVDGVYQLRAYTNWMLNYI